MTTTTTSTDADLVARAHGGDVEALRQLVQSHLHPVWRIATVASTDPATAEAAAVDGFAAGLIASQRSPDPTHALRTRLVAATRRSAAAAGTPTRATTSPIDDPVVQAFCALPEKSRTALWLTEVEGGTPEQVAPVLGIDRSAAALLAERAASGLRDRLAADVAARTDSEACRQALAKLPAHAAGRLTDSQRTALGEHIGSCGFCTVWLAALVSPRPALRGMVAVPPPGLAAAIEARWLEHLEKEHKGWLAPFTERAVGAAAAAVLAIGLGGVAFLGDRANDDDERDRRAEVAVPASGDPDGDDDGAAADDEVAAEVPGPVTPPTTAGGGSNGSSPSSSSSGGGSNGGGSGSTGASPGGPVERPRAPGDDPAPNPQQPPNPSPAPTDPPAPAPDEDATQLSITALDGLLALGVGDCTGLALLDLEIGCVPASDGALSVTIDLPGLPPLSI